MDYKKLKKERQFTTLLSALANKYNGVCSKRMFKIGLESMSDELEANREYEVGDEEEVELDAPEDSEVPDDTNPDAEVLGPMSEDEEVGASEEGAPEEENDEETWDEVREEDLKSDADCISMLKLIGSYVNDYTLNFEQIIKLNMNLIEYTGDFKASPLYTTFVVPSMEILEKVYKDDPIIKTLTGLKLLLEDKRKMMTVVGKPDNPFVYEAIQLLEFELLRTLLAVIPFALKANMSLRDLIDSYKLQVPSMLIEMADSILEVAPVFGTKIYYVEPIKSEITGKSEEIANTQYSGLFEEDEKEVVTGMTLASESIMNLIEIKNNKCLVEFSILNRIMTIISALVKNVDMISSCKIALEQIVTIMNASPESTNEIVDSSIEYFRTEVIQKQNEALAQLKVAEDNALLQTDMGDPANNQIMTASPDIIPEPDVPGPMAEESNE